ncbi:MAG: hypothetical protein VX874_24510 [Pseudomonadota bacterium]|nr:hypothetical protein [Pseudomonadota bacterium]
MSLSKVLVLSLILAFVGAFEVTINAGAHHDPAIVSSQAHCDACPEATEVDMARAQAGSCASGATCMLNAIDAPQQSIVFVQMTSDWMSLPPSTSFVSTHPQLDLPPPRA